MSSPPFPNATSDAFDRVGGYETLVLPILISVIWIAGSIGLLLRRDKEVIRKRGYEFVIAGCFFATAGIWMMGVERSPIQFDPVASCILTLWLHSFFIPMWLSPYILRASYLDLHYRYNLKKLRPKAVNDQDFWFPKYRLLTRKLFFLGIYASIWILNIIITGSVSTIDAPSDGDQPVYSNCGTDYWTLLDLIWAIFLIVHAVFFVWRLWKTSDAYDLRTELKVFLWIFPVGLLSSLAVRYFSTSPSADLYIAFFCALFSFAVSLYYPVYLSFRPEWNGKGSSYAGSVTSSEEQRHLDSKELFTFCLHQPQLLQAFVQYSTELWCAENIQFYLQVQEFKRAFEAGGAYEKALEIVEQFVDPKALTLVNIDENTQQRILQRVGKAKEHRQEGQVGILVEPSLFDEAEATVLTQMRQDTFSKFKASKRLEKVWAEAGLGELQVQEGEEEKEKKKREKEREEERRSKEQGPKKSEEKKRVSDGTLSLAAVELLGMQQEGGELEV